MHFMVNVQYVKGTLVGSALAVTALFVPAQVQAPVDLRVALVIGNAAYASAPLDNPANDARAMGDTLRGLGFTVIEVRDADRQQMLDAIAQTGDALRGKQGVGMLFYAGHGLQLDWHNYMVPVRAELTRSADIPERTVNVGLVIDTFKRAGNRMNILVLDACRDNPFADAASGKGLSPIDAPSGTILAYATAPGNVAEDGDPAQGNGLYTRYLLEEIKRPVSKIEDVFKRVRLQVRKSSQGRQIPWESTSLEDDFYFNTGKVVSVARPDPKLREQAFLVEKAEWDKIRNSQRADDFYAYLQKYPNGLISEQAQAQLDRLDKVRIEAQADRAGVKQVAAAARYHPGDRYEFVLRDGLTGLVTGTAGAQLKRVSDVELLGEATGMASARVTSEGFVLEDGSGKYDPPWPTTPGGEFQVGKKWSARSVFTPPSGRTSWVDIDAHISARESVTVPLGTFNAFRIDYVFAFQDGRRVNSTFWYQPDLGYAVKFQREFRRNNIPNILIREMTAYKRSAG
jgi:hypothetical protein